MKTATIHELKKELSTRDKTQLIDLCLRLSKYKKDNKELLTYLLFEADNEDSYVKSVKVEIELQFENINRANLYWTKKGLRKILRMMDKFIRYSGNKETEVELRIFYCQTIIDHSIPINDSLAISNLFDRQIIKIKKAVSTLHEDLQADYTGLIDALT